MKYYEIDPIVAAVLMTYIIYLKLEQSLVPFLSGTNSSTEVL